MGFQHKMQEVIAALVQDGLAFKKGSRDKQQQQGSGKASETEALMKGVPDRGI